MPVTKLPSPQMGMSVEELTNLMFRYYRELQYLLNGNLDSENVIEAATVKADWVYAGTLTTDQLIAGTAKIGTALIEDLEVGSNVTMGANATISWSQVSNRPSIPSTADITQITANYVATPNLITNIAQVSSYLSLGSGSAYGTIQYKNGVLIEAYNDSIGKGLLYSANTHLFDYSSHVDFSLCADVDFTGTSVIGLGDSGSFDTADGKTVTVSDGLITSIS